MGGHRPWRCPVAKVRLVLHSSKSIHDLPMKTNRLLASLLTALAVVLSGCTSPSSDNSSKRLTHGAVQIILKKGITTQLEVLQGFGSPNITTTNGEGLEVWTYQRHATVSSSSEGYFTVGLAGFGKSGFEQSSRNMTLIIKFGSDKKVADFNSMYSSF